MSLRDFAINGITWTAISQFSRQGVQLVTTLILARILQPADFGLIGMALVIIGFLNVFKDLGTSSAIIQKKEISQQLLSSIFWFNFLFGLSLSVVLIVVAPFFTLFFREEKLTPIIRVFSVSFFAGTMLSLQQALLEKKMNFRRLAMFEIISTVIGAVVGISIAVTGGGVWSLVFQTLSATTVLCIMLWSQNSRWVPSFHFSRDDIRIVQSFSANLTGFTFFNYFSRNADIFIIGRFLGASDLGYYNLAYKVMITPLQNFTAVISRVMYPLLSTIKDDNSQFRKTYVKITTTIAFFTFPLFIVLMIVNYEFVIVIFGQKWIPVAQLLLILSPVGLLQSIDATTGPIYLAKGRTDVMLKWGLFTGLLSICAFYIGSWWGVSGVAAGYLLVTTLWTYYGYKIPLNFIEQDVQSFLKYFSKIVFTTAIASILVILSNKFLFGMLKAESKLVTILIMFSILYSMISFFINKVQIYEILSFFRFKNL